MGKEVQGLFSYSCVKKKKNRKGVSHPCYYPSKVKKKKERITPELPSR